MHDELTLRQALSDPLPSRIRLVFHANGAGYTELRKHISIERCVFSGPLGDLDWVQAMLSAQIALVTIARGAEKVVMPSKTYSSMVAGHAIVAVCSAASDLADLVHKHECGWVVEPGDPVDLRRVFSEIASSPETVLRKRQNAFDAGHKYYDTSVVAREWARVFQSLA